MAQLHSDAEFDSFFKEYAPNVEGFYEVAYWALSDAVIQELVRRHLGVKPGDRILDAGGGTARWACWYAQNLGVTVTVADKSSAMLETAAEVVERNQLSNSIELLEVDLEESDALDGHKFDGIVSTYGVLSFLGSPDAAFRTFARVLKPGGYGLAMGHSLANALGSKIQSEAPFAELKRLVSDSVVKWSDTVPELRVFDTQSLEQLTTSAGLEALSCFGITTVVAPGTEDFGYPYTRVSDISRQLADPVRFNELLEFELDAAQRPGWADRGTNLMQWFRKPRM